VSIKIRCALHGMGLAKDIVVISSQEYEAAQDVPGTIARSAALGGKVLYDQAA